MTTFEALVSMSQTMLRARGEWHGPATAHERIDLVVNQIADLIRAGTNQPAHISDVSLDMMHSAIAELKRRAGTAS